MIFFFFKFKSSLSSQQKRSCALRRLPQWKWIHLGLWLPFLNFSHRLVHECTWHCPCWSGWATVTFGRFHWDHTRTSVRTLCKFRRRSDFCGVRGCAVMRSSGILASYFFLPVGGCRHCLPTCSRTPSQAATGAVPHAPIHRQAHISWPPHHDDCWVLTGTIDSHSRVFHCESDADASGFVPHSAEVSFVARQESGSWRLIRSDVGPPLLDMTIRWSSRFHFLLKYFMVYMWRKWRKRLPMDNNLIWCIFFVSVPVWFFNTVWVNYSCFHTNCLDSACFSHEYCLS